MSTAACFENKTKQKKLVRLEIADGIDMVVLA